MVKSTSTDLQRQCSFDLGGHEQGGDGVEGDVPSLHVVDRIFQSQISCAASVKVSWGLFNI